MAVTIAPAWTPAGAVYAPASVTVPAVAVNMAGDSFTKRPAASKRRVRSGSAAPAAICASAGTTCSHAGSPGAPDVARDTRSARVSVGPDTSGGVPSPRQYRRETVAR